MKRSRFATLALAAIPAFTAVASADEVVGAWEGPYDFPIPGVHSILLPPDGHVLLYSYQLAALPGSEVYVLDPDRYSLVEYPMTAEIFCGAHGFMPDGTVVIVGGTQPGGHPIGEEEAFTFGEDTGFTQIESMAEGRWYPSVVKLKSGNPLVLSGLNSLGEGNPRVERYNPNQGWVMWPLANHFMPLYPRTFLLPSTEVFVAGPSAYTEKLDTVTKQWHFVDNMSTDRWEGCAVLLPPYPGRVLTMGGFNGAADAGSTWKSAEIIDFGDATPEWRPTANMRRKRHHHNAVLLPDGTVLAVGGQRYVNGITVAVRPAEVFDPETETWTLLAAQVRARLYHSTAILLRDGRVLSAGGDGEFSIEIFSPPYLFKGPQPQILSMPGETVYGETFTVETDRPGDIVSVVLMAPGAVTHSVDMNQRYVALDFGPAQPQVVTGAVAGINPVSRAALTVAAPTAQPLAPPGFYLLFLVDANGVPSVGEFILVKKP